MNNDKLIMLSGGYGENTRGCSEEINEAFLSVCRGSFAHEGKILMIEDPSISSLVETIAREYFVADKFRAPEERPVVLFRVKPNPHQKDPWDLGEASGMTNIIYVDNREDVFSQFAPKALFVLGGGKESLDDVGNFLTFIPNNNVFVAKATGGISKELAENSEHVKCLEDIYKKQIEGTQQMSRFLPWAYIMQSTLKDIYEKSSHVSGR